MGDDDADDSFCSQSATLRSANSRQSTLLNHHRRQSASERIDEILENARERADSIATESMSSAGSPGATDGLRRSATSLSFDESLPDETTAFLSRRLSAQQYNTLQNDADGSGGARARRSVYKRSRSTLREEPEHAVEDEEEDRNGTPSEMKQQGWLEQKMRPFRSLELENKGSTARDHLALERTFLAWLRTSLAFTSIGIAVTQLFRLNTSLPDTGTPINHNTLRQVGKPLGAAFLMISIMILLLGYRRYVVGQRWVIEGKFPASRGTVVILVLVTLAIMVLSLVVVIVIHPEQGNN